MRYGSAPYGTVPYASPPASLEQDYDAPTSSDNLLLMGVLSAGGAVPPPEGFGIWADGVWDETIWASGVWE